MINVDKLFRRLSIRAKLVIAFCLFGVVPVAVLGGYGALHSYFLLADTIRDRLRAGVVTTAGEVHRFLRMVEADVLFLGRLPTLQALADIPPENVRERQRLVARLGQEFLGFSRSRTAYYQVRYIDEHGREVVRVDFDGQRHSLLPAEELQDKRDRYYFREAMAIPPGAVYVSPLDLNIERGAVEIPFKPVVRYATALGGARGEPRGIVIVNLYASRILSQVLSLGREMGSVSLANSSGVYLARSEWRGGGRDGSPAGDLPFPAWLASYSERLRLGEGLSKATPDQQVTRDFSSSLAATILSGRAGTVAEPLLGGRIVAFAPIFPHGDGQGEFWVLIHAYQKSQVLVSIRALQLLVLALGGGVLVVALLLGVAAARHFTRPIGELIRGAEAIAQGDFDRPIRVETNDELEDLGRHFARMAHHLKEHERQLREARERAERKASETQALNRIGTEILALLSLPQILQLVVDKARELLNGDLAVLCLVTPGEGLQAAAVSGASRYLGVAPGDLLPVMACEKVACRDARCPAVAEVPLEGHVAVPMRSGDRVVGNLCVAFAEPRFTGPEELEFLSGLANQAAIAIEKARLHREVRDLARLEERERIAVDLHDGIIQSIYATGLGLEECVRLADEDPRELKPKLEAAIDQLNTVIRDVRSYIVGLAPERLQARGLTRALADLARGIALNGVLDLTLRMEPGIDASLNPEQAGQLYQISREALTNVVKHARASRVSLALVRDRGALRLAVEDDGAGFDPARRPVAGQGLHNMEERAGRLGGSLTIRSAPGHGTRVTVEVPLEGAA